MASSIPVDTVAFCRKCGKPLTQESRREWQGIPYCEPCLEALQTAHASAAAEAEAQPASPGPAARPAASVGGPVPSPASAARRSSPADGSVSPVLAGILGFIPGVGAVYNGQFAKGILHVVIFGLLVSIVAAEGTADLRPMFVFLVILMAIYMPIEAYRTARALERGDPAEEFSGILSVFGSKKPSPAGGVVLIVLGVVFLLNTLGYWRLGDVVVYWPVLLIGLGIFMLYRSVSQQAREDRLAALGGGPGGQPPGAAGSRWSGSSESAGAETTRTGEDVEGPSELRALNG